MCGIAGICKVNNPGGISLATLERTGPTVGISNVAVMVRAGM